MIADPASLDLGANLHQARENRGVSLSRIADVTKISIGILHALECNDISRLPGGVIGRAFVRAFATEVGLDPEATVGQFVAQFPVDSVTVGYPMSEQRPDSKVVETRRPASRTLVLAGGVILLAAFPMYFAAKERTRKHEVVQITNDAAIAKSVPNELATAGIVVGTPVPVLVPAESADVRVGLTEGAAPSAATLAATSLAAATADGLAAVQPTGAPESVPSVDSAVGAMTDEEPMTEESSKEPTGRLIVVLAAIRPSWVIATIDGQKAISRLLDLGEQETLSGRDLIVTAGDAGAIVITINGAAPRPLGRQGETITARFNRTNLKKYLAPR